MNARPGGTCRGRRTLVCPRLGMPARASSNAMETKKKQHVGVGKARVKGKGKDDEK